MEIKTDLSILEKRFYENKHRHPKLSWETAVSYFHCNEAALRLLKEMEESGGEPDIVELNGRYYLADCSKESPIGRRSSCYDEEARMTRKKAPPLFSATGEAERIGARLMTEEEYRMLQSLEAFDLKTSSWLKTPEEIRTLGGAIFGDRRYGRTFVYHNGAESYFSARGFRLITSLPLK